MIWLKVGLTVSSICFSPPYAAVGHQKAPLHFPSAFFPYLLPFGEGCRSFWSTLAGTLPASVRKYPIYSCVGYL